MTVSIILPTYNGAARIGRAIDSVIAQTYTDWELIIIDDGSADDIQIVLPSDERIRYFKNEQNQGIQKSLNRGLAEAKGKYVARIDDDDVWSDANKLEKQTAFLESNPEYVLIGTGVVLVDEKGNELSKYISPTTDEGIRKHMLRKNCFAHPSVLFRASDLRYRESASVRHIEDYDLWLRMGAKAKFANLPFYGVTLTVRTSSLTARHRVVQARRAIGLVWQYRKTYPGFLAGLCVSCARLVFFMIQTIIPIPASLVYLLQAKQRSGN